MEIERPPIPKKLLLVAAVALTGVSLWLTGNSEITSASSKGVNPPLSDNPKATATAEVSPIKLTPTPIHKPQP